MEDKIIVTPELLKSTASYVTEQATNYKQSYEKLYTEVETMAASWQGVDNQAYTTQIVGFKTDFDAMYKLMNQYAEFLTKAANAYEATQSELVTKAKKLVY
ncbi:MAG: WXG100 family type VII secretion target [Oliverpabstia sp.]